VNRFKMLLQTEDLEFEVSQRAEPKLDPHGIQKVQAKTNIPLWDLVISAAGEHRGMMVFPITVAAAQMPVFSWREPVEVIGLEIIPWKSTNGDGGAGVVYRAEEIRSLAGRSELAA
jgi:hypothetical protein